MRYLLEHICTGIFLSSALLLAMSAIAYSVHGLWRLCADTTSCSKTPEEQRYSAEDEAWEIIRACFDGMPEKESK